MAPGDEDLSTVSTPGERSRLRRVLLEVLLPPPEEIHFDHWTERLKRWVCRRIGHVPHKETRGEPVTLFYVCKRCGKYERAR